MDLRQDDDVYQTIYRHSVQDRCACVCGWAAIVKQTDKLEFVGLFVPLIDL